MKVTASPSGQQQRPPQRPQAPTPPAQPAPRQKPAVADDTRDAEEDLTASERFFKFVRTKWKIILPVILVVVIGVVY